LKFYADFNVSGMGLLHLREYTLRRPRPGGAREGLQVRDTPPAP
jgi:hypothetical protein